MTSTKAVISFWEWIKDYCCIEKAKLIKLCLDHVSDVLLRFLKVLILMVSFKEVTII